jgi:hypothetical protein
LATGDDTNTGAAAEQPTAADIDQGALSQLKRQLGELTGGELDLTDVQVINLITAIGARTDSDGSVTHQRIIFPGKFCVGARLMDVTGQAVTAGNGAVTFLLSRFICATRLSVLPPVNLVATPFSTRPVYVTTQYKLVPDPAVPGAFTDLEITLLAWSSGGSPAPEVAIDWRCRLVEVDIIF